MQRIIPTAQFGVLVLLALPVSCKDTRTGMMCGESWVHDARIMMTCAGNSGPKLSVPAFCSLSLITLSPFLDGHTDSSVLVPWPRQAELWNAVADCMCHVEEHGASDANLPTDCESAAAKMLLVFRAKAQCLYGVLVEVLIFVIVYVGGGPGCSSHKVVT